MTPEPTPDIGPLLSALADQTRRSILDELATTGPHSASGLTATLPISRQAIARHLAILEEVGVVTREKRGREIALRVVPAQLREAERWFHRAADEWDTQLESLKRLAESPAREDDPNP